MPAGEVEQAVTSLYSKRLPEHTSSRWFLFCCCLFFFCGGGGGGVGGGVF